MKFTQLFIGSALVAMAFPAFSQDVATTVKAEKNPELKRTTIELRPIETLASATPGIASAGASAEFYVGHNWAVLFGGSYGDIDLPQKFVGTANEKKNTPIANDGYAFNAGTGMRYYEDAIGDSAYGGVTIDYNEQHATWKLNDDVVAVNQYAVTPSLVAGYRWVWQNGLLARLGAGVGLPSTQSQTVVNKTSGPDAVDANNKVTDLLDQNVIAKIDLGIGVMF